MNSLKEKKFDTGIIVGRFQVAELHSEHLALIDSVRQRCDHVVIFLGLSPVVHSRNNPLDFKSRKVMINEVYPDIDVHWIKDVRDDSSWSIFLDNMIQDIVPRNHSVGLFGSRDSFIAHYTGCYKTVELESERLISGTEQRNRISREIKNSKDFRSGQIFSSYGRYPTSYTTIDAVILDHSKDMVLLGKKSGESAYRLPGGFVDPTDKSLEDACAREISEECGQFSHHGSNSFIYLGSFRVDDWRYRTETDKILTTVFQVDFMSGPCKPGDDLSEIRWFKINEVSSNLVEEHLWIWNQVKSKIQRIAKD